MEEKVRRDRSWQVGAVFVVFIAAGFIVPVFWADSLPVCPDNDPDRETRSLFCGIDATMALTITAATGVALVFFLRLRR